jgi:bifunctional non-homologous end joining protein LigD
VETIEGVLQTPDGYWRVEAVKSGRRERWFRIWHATTLVQDRAALATVERILGDAYATLEPVSSAEETNGVA